MKLSGPLKARIMTLMILYPVFVFLAVAVLKLPMSIISMAMLIIGVAGYLAYAKSKSWWMPAAAGVTAIILVITNSEIVLRFYPICITLVFLWLFGASLIKKDPVVFHFAILMDCSIKTHPGRNDIEHYCKIVTFVWVIWFIISLAINVHLTLYGNIKAWAIYNGPVCWGIQGSIFAGEFIVRYFVNNRIADKYNLPHQTFFAVFKRKQQ